MEAGRLESRLQIKLNPEQSRTRTMLFRFLVLLMLVVPLYATPAWSKSDAANDAAINRPTKTKEDLPNFHEVHPFLYRGGEPTRKGLEKVKEMGVKTVIDLRAKSERTMNERKVAESLGMKYVNLPMSSKAPTTKQVKTFLKAVDKAEEATKNGKPESVFIHCAHGSDRTGCLVGVYRVTHDKYSYDDAFKEMRKYWFGVRFTNLSGTVKKYADEATAKARTATQ